jgi:hypothetical protein
MEFREDATHFWTFPTTGIKYEGKSVVLIKPHLSEEIQLPTAFPFQRFFERICHKQVVTVMYRYTFVSQ